MTLLAHGYCRNQSFKLGAENEVITTLTGNSLVLQIGSVKVLINREEWSRESDYRDISYLYYDINITCNETVLLNDKRVTEFTIFSDEHTYYLVSRFTNSQESQIHKGFGTRIRAHAFTKDGLYREIGKKVCNCQNESIGPNGCKTCLHSYVKELNTRKSSLVA